MAMTWTANSNWDADGWRHDAACRHTDAEMFFPAGTTGSAVEQIDAAKAVCRSCPVQRACLDYALESNQEAGVWGGTDEDERRRMRRGWRASRRPPVTAAPAAPG